MRNKKAVIILIWAIALGVVVVCYFRTSEKPLKGTYPIVIVPPQGSTASAGKIADDLEIERKKRELEHKQVDALKDSLERANKSGSVAKAQPTP